MATAKKRQWQRYVDESLLKTNQVTNVAIHGLDGSEWASSKDFHVSSEQVLNMIACINGVDNGQLKRSGVKVASQGYVFLRCDPGRSIYGRMGAESGVCIVKTSRVLLVGVYEAGVQPGNCNAVMEKLADYLIDHGL